MHSPRGTSRHQHLSKDAHPGRSTGEMRGRNGRGTGPFPPIKELAVGIRSGRTTSEQLVEQCLTAIARQDGHLNAFITVLADEARADARRADRELRNGHDRGILHGIPISVKDLIDLGGLPTTAASTVRDGHRAATDAPVLSHLRAAGAVFVGKCNLHEFAFGTTGEDSAYGPTRNPHAPGHIPGGSSSGSAVSVAAGMAIASVGTDTGGSIRIPAAACGVVGLKPTYGELSCDGVVPLARTLDHVGPLASTVSDAACLYEVMAGHASTTEPTHAPPGPVAAGVLRPYFLDRLDDGVRRNFDALIDRLRHVGWDVHDVVLPHAEDVTETYRQTVMFEAFNIHRTTLSTCPDAYSPRVRARLELGATVSERDYAAARRTRDTLTQEVDALLETRECLVLPTLPMPAPPIGTETISLGVDDQPLPIRELTLRLTQLFDLTGHPALSIPMGVSPGGLPTAVQLVGRTGRTAALLRTAARYEDVIRDATDPGACLTGRRKANARTGRDPPVSHGDPRRPL